MSSIDDDYDDDAPRMTLFEIRCLKFYDELVANKKDGKPEWEGAMQDAILNAKIPMNSRTAIVKHLSAIECIRVIQTGNGQQPTVIRLLRDPREVDGQTFRDEEKSLRALTRATRHDILSGQVAAIQRQLGGLDIVQVLNAVNLRLSTIDTRLDKIEKGVNGETQEFPQTG